MGFFGRKRAARKTAVDQDIIDKLEMLARVEKRIAQFYHLCSETRQEEREFWRKMAESERRHVEHVHRMQEIYSAHPQQFEPGYPFDIAAIRLFDLSLRELPTRSRLVEIDFMELLCMVEEIENSMVEMNHGKVLKSRNEEFNRLAASLEAESEEHRRTISAMIEPAPDHHDDR